MSCFCMCVRIQTWFVGQIVKRKTFRWRVVGVERQIEKEERERAVSAMNRKHPEWIPRDGHAWLGWTGLDLGGGGWVGGWEAHARPAGHKERDRKMTERKRERERERPPGADRCSPPLQLRPHSWPGSLYIFLYAYVSLSLSLSPPVKTHAEILRITHTTSYGMLHHVHYSSFNMASLPTKLQHSHNSSHNCPKLKTSTHCWTLGKSPLMHPSCVLLQIITSRLICSRGMKYSTVTPNKAVRFPQAGSE